MILEGLHEKEIFSNDSPVRIVFSSEENFQYPDHWHNAVELIYVLNNGCTIKASNQDFVLSQGDIMIIAPCDIHKFHKKKGGSRNLIIQFDLLKLNFFEGFSKMLPYISVTRKLCLNDGEIYCKIEDQMKTILQYLDTSSSDSALTVFLYARILDIIVLLYKNRDDLANNSIKPNPGKLQKLDSAFTYIENNYQKNISLKDAAKACGFSEYYFSRLFKAAADKSFTSFLNDYRITKAEALLVESGLSITEAAYASGFNSAVTFNRIFKQVKGLSPSEFLKIQV